MNRVVALPRKDIRLPENFPEWTPSKQDAVWRYRDFLTTQQSRQDRDDIATIIYNGGAYCGDCEYQSWESCVACRRTCRGYADDLLDAGYRLAVNPQ